MLLLGCVSIWCSSGSVIVCFCLSEKWLSVLSKVIRFGMLWWKWVSRYVVMLLVSVILCFFVVSLSMVILLVLEGGDRWNMSF